MPALLDKRLVFVTGKGGVGKTTVATALGLAAARQGKRTIVCEVARQERMSRAFRREGVGYSETELAERLFAISVDPQRALEEYLQDQIGSRRLTGMLFHNRIFEYFAAAAPGVRELVTIGKIWELAQLERRNRKNTPYDLVIVDSPATGHGLAMLRAPRTFGDIARVGPIRRRADLIDGFIRNRANTGVVAVALPEEMPVNETIEFRARLADDVGLEIDAVVVNGLLQERFDMDDMERIHSMNGAAPSPAAAAALRAALSEHQRARVQRAELRRLERELDGELVTLPYLWEPELALDDLEQLAGRLEQELP